MDLKYRKLGSFIKKIGEKNKDGLYDEVLGVAIEKEFMPSVANTIGTDLKKYNVLRKKRFAFNPMHVGRDEKLPIAIYRKDVPALVSPAYMTFEVTDVDINVDYLMMIFKTSIFDRLCWFHTDSSVRGGLTWDDFCDLDIYIPSLEIQQKTLRQFKKISNRIESLKKENEILGESASLYYKFWSNSLKKQYVEMQTVIDVRDGTHDSPVTQKEGYPLVTSTHLHEYDIDITSANKISEKDYIKINERSRVDTNDILMSMIGTVGMVSLVNQSQVSFAIKNVALFKTSKKRELTYHLMMFLKSFTARQYIETSLAGSTQQYISLKELRKMPFFVPNELDLNELNNKLEPLISRICINIREINVLTNLNDLLLQKIMS